MDEDEQREAAAALWEHADAETRAALEMTLAKELKFRPQSVRRLSADRVVGRLTRMAEGLPESVLFQYLFHLHMEKRREILVAFLDGVELPHKEGVLDLPEDAKPPTAEVATTAASAVLKEHDRKGLVYLATLKVADSEFWSGLDDVLEGFTEAGEKI
jgi:hypothetical protein